MPTKPTHTPTPWKLGTILDTIILDANNQGILSLNQRDRKEEENKANAAHIVKCVNSHHELVTALKGAQSVIRKALPFLPADKEAVYAGEWLDEINEAIANAEGGK